MKGLLALSVLLIVSLLGLFKNQVEAFDSVETSVTGDSSELFLTDDVVDEYQAEEADESVSVTFYNDFYDRTLDLMWKNNGGDDVLISTIEPRSEAIVNTFTGHEFLPVIDGISTSKISPQFHRIFRDVLYYHFGPSDVESTSTTVQNTELNPLVKLINSKSYSVSAKFRNLAPAVDIWFESGADGSYQGSLELGKEMTINTYEGHVFFFTRKGNKKHVLARHTMTESKVLYLVEDPENPPPKALVEQTEREIAFMAEYLARTGIQWRHYFGPDGPRGPPMLYMWPASMEGQIHNVQSNEGQWKCKGTKEHCQSSEPVDLQLEVISTAPRAFLIKNFLSPFEAQSIIDIAEPTLKGSTVGNRDGGGTRNSETRTSRNAWVPRGTNDVTRSLFLRAAHLLNIPEQLLNSDQNAEDMQVVYYKNGQKYDSHHDWGVSGYPNSRYITLLLYLNNQTSPQSGGETAFPKGAQGKGFKIHPGQGNAILFYNLLEDGNADDLALHAALPVFHGEKWLANFWVWDPKRR